MPRKPTVSLDFDGVLAEYTGWRGKHHTGKPIAGALEFLTVYQRTHQFVIHSVREPEAISKWLIKHGFPAIPVTNVKPKASAYIDDRAIRFDGDWLKVAEVLQIQPWWKS
ncbi:hypothetical protein [Brevibacillus sp. SYSU BS000544]|uniref:hypothetical protein n=1 Tax=Brevibacillus sp. SYSU BS000544 TaxID=3416443 RepID=UPI003CE52A50